MTQLTLALTSKPLTDCERVLRALQDARGEWVSNLYRKTGCMVHSRIADLRRQGYNIEGRPDGKGPWKYRLVEKD
jgi:hypothetical protein